MTWMLANETVGHDLYAFQHRHGILRSVLQFLTKELNWSVNEVQAAETAMVLVDSGTESSELTDKLRWFEQSSEPTIRLLVSLTNGILGREPKTTSVRIIQLCMKIVDLCLSEPWESNEKVFRQLEAEHDLGDCSFSVSELSTVFQLVQRLDQQGQETQLFRR